MSEAAMWDAIRPVMKNLHPVRIENIVASGTPDVNYTHGWIELKYLGSWPVRAETIVTIDHFTPQQRVWLTKRSLAGGRAFLLLKVGKNDWLLFSGIVAAQCIGKVSKDTLYERAIAYWDKLPTNGEMEKWLL